MQIKRELWVFCEIENKKLSKRTRNLLLKARKLCENTKYLLGAVVIDENFKDIVKSELQLLDVHKAYCHKGIDNQYSDQITAEILHSLINQYAPDIFLFTTSSTGKSLSAFLAGRLKTGLTADCIDLYIEPKEELLVQSRLISNESKIAKIVTPNKTPQMATVLFNDEYEKVIFAKATSPVHIIECTDITHQYNDNVKVLYKFTKVEPLKDLFMYDIILAGGLGLGCKENFQLLQEVGKKINAGIGATRAVVDMGWVDEKALVGMSGAIVDPLIYIAFGISGSPQHLIGMQQSKTVVSINIDENAPINSFSDYIILSDAIQILTELYNQLKSTT